METVLLDLSRLRGVSTALFMICNAHILVLLASAPAQLSLACRGTALPGGAIPPRGKCDLEVSLRLNNLCSCSTATARSDARVSVDSLLERAVKIHKVRTVPNNIHHPQG